LHCREQQADQNCNDGDYHQQFDKREATPGETVEPEHLEPPDVERELKGKNNWVDGE
jgi:hypothetical protein